MLSYLLLCYVFYDLLCVLCFVMCFMICYVFYDLLCLVYLLILILGFFLPLSFLSSLNFSNSFSNDSYTV